MAKFLDENEFSENVRQQEKASDIAVLRSALDRVGNRVVRL
jgi:hypothetical protein